MNKDLTDITVVLDRSGSMSKVQEEAEKGLNAFIAEQTGQPGHATFTLVQFDTEYEFVHRGVPIEDVPHCDVVPRGMTALHDAVGRAINETGERLKNLQEEERPGLVVFVILTDGYENSSHEFNLDDVKRMISHQTDRYKWQFTFLGANQDAFSAGGRMGVPAAAIANFKGANTSKAYGAASANVARMRCATSKSEPVSNAYLVSEREEMEEEDSSTAKSTN